MKIFSNIVNFLITIGSNTERRKSRVDYGNMAMIIFYFIQLIGYVFSQFESKSAKFYENDYLAQIGQYSSLPFIMITISYDPFTILMFAAMFLTILSIYGALLLQIYYKPLEPTHTVNRFMKFYFQNFQWYFLTPFHECMVGIKTCGSLAYLKMYSDKDSSWSQISLWFMIPSILGQILLLLSGFLSLYCFRNYEFIQGDLMRKFTILNFLAIMLHMILQMCNFWRDFYMYSEIIKHFVLILILVIHSVDSYVNLPFGFSNETIFFSQILGCSTFFEILVAIWIFSNNDDGIIFLTFVVFVPLINIVVQGYFERYFDQECSNYCMQNNPSILSNQEAVQKDRILILKYMHLHCQECREVLCPCRQKISKFVSNTLNVTLIYLWIQFQFQKAMRFVIENKLDYEIFESLGIKFVTFLQRYRENQILSQKIIQDILFTYQKLPKHSYPYFFLNLTQIIQKKNIFEMEIQSNSGYQISKVQFKTLNDISLYLVYEQEILASLENAIITQRKFWLLNQKKCSMEELLLHSNAIYETTQILKNMFQKYQQLRQRPLQDTILIQRMKILISLVCMDDLYASLKLSIIINKEESESIGTYNLCQFLNGSALSVISQVSTQTLGSIQRNHQLNPFFGYEQDSQYLDTIDKLLPSKIGMIHNGLIENCLQRGRSDRLNQNSEQFILNKDNFIERVTICLNVVFPLLNDEYQFLMIAHLLKSNKSSKDQDNNKRGYILVDSEFLVFGLTKNIFERLYQPNQTYENTLIFQLIPEVHQIMEQYFKIQALANQKKIARQAQLCLKESGFIGAPEELKRSVRKQESTVKLTNKNFANILKDQRKNMNIKKSSLKTFQIEYSVLLKVLTPTVNDQVKEFLYFIVEIDFQDDPVQTRLSQRMIQTSQLIKTLKSTYLKQNQSNNIFSNEDQEVDLIVDMSNTGSRRSQSDLANRISKVENQINDNSLPGSLKGLVFYFTSQILMFIAMIIIISAIFKHKKDIQSNCIQQITFDLNFLDAYSLAMAGSRHTIYFRDFYPLINDSQIIINNTQINVSKHDKLYMAWLQLSEGLSQLIDMYQNYSQIVENSKVKLLNIYIINYNLNSKMVQPLESFATYYQIMLQVFYMAYKQISASPDAFLMGFDKYNILTARSIIFYNFLDVVTNANSTLEDCQIYNEVENNFFDAIIVNYFIAIYIVLSLQFIVVLFFYSRVTKSIKLYQKLLNMCDCEDQQYAIQRCDYFLSMFQYDRLIFRQKQFQSILAQPANIFEDLRKIDYDATIRKQKKSEVSAQNQLLLVIVLISLIQYFYVFSLQIYYLNLQNNIQPINNRALMAQQMRLNFILSVNRFDLFLIKSYFQEYNGTNLSNNLKSDTLILKQIEISTSILEEDIRALQSINFADLLFQSSQLNENEQQQVLTGDVCQLTDCNMESDLLSVKSYKEQFSPLFYEGIVSLHRIILQFLEGSAAQILDFTNLGNILDDPIYIIYFVWGMDAIQYQISQFSQYFIDISMSVLVQMTASNQVSIILSGFGIIFMLLIIQWMFVKLMYKKYLLSKYMLRIVPLPILFQRNIPKHLSNSQRRHKYF